MKLTYYLLDSSVKEFRDVMEPRKLDGPDRYEQVAFAQELPFPAQLYIQQNRQSQPKWWSFFNDHVVENAVVLYNQTNGAVLVLKAADRFFAITFGFGYHAINQDKVVYDFGLVCSLKATDPKQLRTVDARNIDVVTKQRRTFASRTTEVAEFGIDDTREIIHKLSGIPLDANLGKTLSGRDAVNLNSQVDLEHLGDKCEQLLNIYNSETDNPLVDIASRIAPVRNETLIKQLDESLLEAVKDRSEERLTISFDSLFWDKVQLIKIFKGGLAKEDDELEIDLVFRFFEDHIPNVSIDDIKSTYVIGLDEDGAPVDKKRALYSLLSYETVYAEQHYVFSLGSWIAIAADLLNEVNTFVAAIPIVEIEEFLPPLTAGEREDDYNDRAANERGYLLLDQVNFPAQGASTVEVCDLLTADMDFICVKKETKSATLSHLFAQGSVSAILLHDHQGYRNFITNQLPDNWALPDVGTGAGKENIRFVYAVATDRDGLLSDILPFFSKVNLRTHTMTIQRMSFKVALHKIEVVPKK